LVGKTIQYPNGGYFIVASNNSEFIGDFLKGLLTLEDEPRILSMSYDGFQHYDPKIMSDYSIIFGENVYLQKNKKNMKKEVYTFDKCENYLDILKENTVQKLIKEGISEKSAKSLIFEPFHMERWKVKFCKYKNFDNHPLVHPTSNIALRVSGDINARKMLCNLGLGNSTGFGFGFVGLKEDKD